MQSSRRKFVKRRFKRLRSKITAQAMAMQDFNSAHNATARRFGKRCVKLKKLVRLARFLNASPKKRLEMTSKIRARKQRRALSR